MYISISSHGPECAYTGINHLFSQYGRGLYMFAGNCDNADTLEIHNYWSLLKNSIHVFVLLVNTCFEYYQFFFFGGGYIDFWYISIEMSHRGYDIL